MVALYLNRKDAADYLKTTYGIPCSVNTLAKFACGMKALGTTEGPPYRKVNKATLYTKWDLDTWAKTILGPAQTTTHGDLIT